jgi:hypothetical protein
MQVAETAGALGLARVWHHTQNSPVLSTLGVRLPLPAPRSKNRRADPPKAGFHVSQLLEPAGHIRELG